ncbi:MAG TPA: universal stress protein [Ilumatobacter sp.]|nr:universal stress protein [Ilumatobacter sp.]
MDVARVGPVVVGIDGSANAQRAMLVAARHADATGAALVVVHAIGLTEVIDGEHVPSHDHEQQIGDQVEAWCEALREDGHDEFEVRLVHGPPVDVMLRTAHDDGASLIVVGRRGAGNRPELRLGSTAHQIVEHSHCPVLVIPPIARSASVGDGSR